MSLAWVTGAAGFIGRHLVRHLVRSGADVAGLDLVAAPAGDEAPIAWCTGALSAETLAQLARRTGLPETIYHLAGGSSVGASLADPWRDFTATVGGTAALLEWMRTSAPQTRLVIVSSAAVYGDGHDGPIAEDAATAPFSPYGAHKFAMEATCRGWATSFDLSMVVVRLFSVYGPGLTKQLLWDLSGRLIGPDEDVVLGGSGAELRDWTHIDDVVRALVAAAPLATPAVPVVNAGSGVAHSVRRVAEHLATALDRDPSCLRFNQVSRPGDPFSLVAAAGRLDRLGFDWRVGLEEGLADYARWYRARAQSPEAS